MENNVVKKIIVRKLFFIPVILITLFLVYFLIMSVVSPGRKMAELNKEFEIKPDRKEIPGEDILSDSTYLKLLKEKAFLQSKTVMAQTDSIYLTINLSDSTSQIEISGVTVHISKIIKYSISRILERSDDHIYSTMLSSPFIIKNTRATIRKEPVMVKTAPKDTSEYKPDVMPDTSLVEPVIYMLEMTNGFRIYVFQNEKESASDRRNIFIFDLSDRIRNAWHSLKSVVLLRVPEYHPFIKITLPRDDGKIIFRALPKNGHVAVYR